MFQSRVIRARYSVAYPGWHLKPHIDYPHPKTNGFRVHIPVFTNEKIRTYFLIDDEWCEIYFEPGHAWFMNVSVPHKIDHEGDFDRVYLTLDLWACANLMARHFFPPLVYKKAYIYLYIY